MSSKIAPLIFSIQVADFDLRNLPISPDLLKADRAMLEAAISGYYAELFRPLGGEADITVADGTIWVRWIPESGLTGLVENAVALLQRGDYGTAVPMLIAAKGTSPEDPVVLFNLGMALSDLKRLDEAIPLLELLVKNEPGNVQAWNALGVAHTRKGDAAAAEVAFRKSYELDPDDGYTNRNLGGLVSQRSHEEVLPLLKHAAELLPDDQMAQFGYGNALMEVGDMAAADGPLKKVIEINPLAPVAEAARSGRTKIAHAKMRGSEGGNLRTDGVTHCLAAIRLFDRSPEKRQSVTFEIALVGRKGLDINNPAEKYTLKSLEGTFSGLQLVSLMYVGLRQLAPFTDPGIDLAAEYKEAMRLYKAETH